ncbi:MAG: RNA polymerase sporulation sigma factor SigK [Oscillospiraceae bacterium]|nr:RNA polymerase sporulation sigma factor SigK [Oscillospiraceae bacterium]
MTELLFEILRSVFLLTGYVSGESSFPPPLDAEEEKKYIELYRGGDADAKNVLIERNLRLVAHIAKKYASSGCDPDDLISVGTIGLIKGINTFSPEKNPRLSSYIARCIENEVLMVMRNRRKLTNEVSIDDTIGVDKEGKSFTFSDILSADTADFADFISDKIEMQKLAAAMKSALNKNETDILRWHYGLNNTQKKTQNEIAEIMGISRSYVSRIEKKALEKLLYEMRK